MKAGSYIIIFLLGCLLLQNCSRQGGSTVTGKEGELAKFFTDSIVPEYATKFKIYQAPSCRVLTVNNPWQGAEGLTYRYVLSHDTARVPDLLKGSGECIPLPVNRVVCMSTTHVGMLAALGYDSCIAGISGTRYVVNARVRDRIKQGAISEIGYESSLNYEELLRIKPDVIFAYGVGGEVNAWYDRIRVLRIPVVFIAEYLEESPLGRAEWIRFMAEFFLAGARADNFFYGIRDRYVKISRISASTDVGKPVVMTGLPWKDAWNVAPAGSYISSLIADAGGIYWCNDLSVLPGYKNLGLKNYLLSIETAITKAAGAEVWINAGAATSLADIWNTDERLANISPFKQGQVYNNNARMSPEGGNDYWESGTVHPELILEDLYRIFHPEQDTSNNYHYFIHLK